MQYVEGMPEESRRLHVFLSYSSIDRAIADQLATELRELGIDVWYDARLQPGDKWELVISRQLMYADAILVLATPSSIESHWVTSEWASALARSQLVIPVVVGGGFEILRGPLAEIQGIEYEPGVRKSVTELAGRLRSVTAQAERSGERADRSATLDEAATQHGGAFGNSPTDLQRIIEMTVRQTMDQLSTEQSVVPASIGDLVFHITSFSPDMEPAAEAVKLAASAVGLTAKRVKDVPGDYRITDRILRMIEEARIVVVDLTHERPNVYFELGYARGLGKRVVTIIKANATAHFDVQDWTYISYSDSRPLEADLRVRFEYEVGLTDGHST